MFSYTQEELLEKIEKAINKMTASQYKVDKQSLYLGNFLKEIKTAIEKEGSVNIKNIKREITNSINVNRPDWIEELKLDTNDLEDSLENIISTIENKEAPTEFDMKESEWLTSLLKDIAKTQEETTNVLSKKLKPEKIKIPKKMKVSGTVDVGNKLEIKEPKWLPKQIDNTKILEKIEKKIQPKDDKEILEALGKLTTTEDTGIIAEYLQALLDKENFNLEDLLVDGKIPVAVDKVGGGGGGGGIDKSGLSTEDKQDALITSQEATTAAVQDLSTPTDIKLYYVKEDTTDSTYIYYLFAGQLGWQIRQEHKTTGVVKYASGTETTDAEIDTQWGNRGSLTYNYI